MLKIVRKTDAATRKIADNKFVLDYITKDTSSDISFVIIEGADFEGETTIVGNRIYFVLSGTLVIDLDGERTTLSPDDSCFISAGTKYKYVMSGKFKIITVDQPAHD